MKRLVLLPVGLSALALLSSCTVVDIRGNPGAAGVESEGVVEGYATVGWAHDPPIAKIQLLGGRSRGSIVLLDLWYLGRLEVGAAGAAAGIGPLDAGVGTLFYHPRSPAIPPPEEEAETKEDIIEEAPRV